MSSPTEEAEQVEEIPVEPVARHHTEGAEAPATQGTPYGRIALGLVSVLTLASLGLYNALGPLGLAAGGAAATAGAAGYGAHRYRLAHPRKERHSRSPHERKARSGRDSHGGRAGKASSLFSGASRSGRGAVFSAGAGRKGGGTSSRMPTLGRAASALGKRSATGGPGGKRMKFAGHKGGSGPKSGRGKLGYEKSKGGKGGQVHRTASTRGAQATGTPFRTAGRAVRGWDARTTAALVELVAWMAKPFRRRRAAREVPKETPEGAVTPEAAEPPESVVHQGEPPITNTVTCPRCGSTHTVTIPGGNAERIVTCECGYKIRFFRIPADQQPSATERPPHPRASLPTRPVSSSHTNQGAPMSFGLITHATELPTIAASYASDDMMEVKAHLELLRELPLQAAASIRILTDRLGADYPLNQQVVEAMQRVYEALCTAVPPAEEVAGVFASAHADDINRRLQPRTNERLWNA